MANDCTTTYKITGHSDSLTKLHKTIVELKNSNTYGIVDFNSLAEHYNLPLLKWSTRGYIHNIQLENNILTLTTWTTNQGYHDLFFSINKIFEDTLSISYQEVEPNYSIYRVHDEGGFFPEQTFISIYDEELPVQFV